MIRYRYHKIQVLKRYHFIALYDSVLSGTVGPKAIVSLKEFGFTNRLHDLQNTLLYQPVYYCWDAKRTHFAVGLWDFYPHRLKRYAVFHVPIILSVHIYLGSTEKAKSHNKNAGI